MIDNIAKSKQVDKTARANVVQAQESSTASNSRKLLLSVLLGLVGFAGSFFSPTFQIPPHTISITWFHIFPLIIAMAYGPRYGVLAGTAGLVAFQPFFSWPDNGWANIVPSLLEILFYAWHGYFAQARRRESTWRNHPLIAQVPFAIIYGLGVLILYPFLFSFNPPFWLPTAATYMSKQVIIEIILKSTISMYGCVLAAAFILLTPAAGRLLGVSSPRYARYNGRILLGSIGSMVGVWLLWHILNSIFVDGDFPYGIVYLRSPAEIVTLFVVIVSCLVSGYVVVTFTEKRCAAEEALSESEVRFRLLVESAPDAIFVQSRGRFVYVNSAMVRLVGASGPDELLGRDFKERMAPEFHEAIGERIRFQRETGKAAPLHEQQYLRMDGSRVSVETTAVAICYQGTDSHLVLVRDISDRKQAEDALKASESRFRGICEASNVGIAVGDIGGNVIFANEAFRKLLQYSAEELAGMNFARFTHSDDVERELILFQELVSGRRDQYRVEKRYITKNNSIVWVDVRVSLIPDKPGLPFQCVGVVLDITDRKQAEEREKSHQLELTHAARLSVMGQMASEIAHELNQPLCAIITYADSCLRSAKTTESNNNKLIQNIETIIKQAERAGVIVSRVKGFARKSTGVRSTVYINEIMDDALGMVTPELKRHSIEIELELQQDLQPIQADPIQIEQVVLNLIQNSIDVLKNAPQTKRKLAITTGIKEDKVEVSVADLGGGISDENIDKLFSPFFTTKSEGLGVGLSISRSIIESHGGNLNFRDNSNEGVTFYFALPINT